MATSTPNKRHDSIATQLTPVKLLDSPRPNSGDANFATYKSRLDIIVKTLLEDFNKWQRAEKSGLSICKSIEAIKTRSLQAAAKEDGSEGNASLYPDELKPYTTRLAVLVGILDDIAANAEKALKQLNALGKMETIKNHIFYRTWTLQRIAYLCGQVAKEYRSELKIKYFVMRNIAHCMNRPDLVRMTTLWEYPQYVDDYLSQLFVFFKAETNANIKS